MGWGPRLGCEHRGVNARVRVRVRLRLRVRVRVTFRVKSQGAPWVREVA